MVATTPAVSAPEAPAMEPEVAPSTPDNLACAAERSGAATDDGSGSVCIVNTAAAGHAAAFVPRIAAAALPRDSCTGRECPPAREHLFLNPPRCPLSSLSDHVPREKALKALGATRTWSTLTYMGQLQVAEAVLSNRAILVPGKLEAPRRDILEILDVGLLADRNKGAYARSWCNHLQQDWREEMEMKCK